MTALSRYQKLECPGLWRPHAGAQRREVVVSFGKASLVLADGRSGTPLSHWSLPAVRRRNPGEMPAIFVPDAGDGADSAEMLELDEAEMVAALDTIQASLGRRRGRGRLRSVLASAALVVALLGGVLWLPGALQHHALSVIPPAGRAEIDRQILADLASRGHPQCSEAAGLRALARMQERLLGTSGRRLLRIVDHAAPRSMALPGGQIVLTRALVMAHDGPEVMAGFVLAAQLSAQQTDPLAPVLDHAGVFATVRLLTTGALPPGSVSGFAGGTMDRGPDLPDLDQLVQRFAAVEVASSPFGWAVDPTGETTLTLIEADPHGTRPSPRPILSDGDWIAIQGICAD